LLKLILRRSLGDVRCCAFHTEFLQDLSDKKNATEAKPMSVLEYLLGGIGAGLLQAALGIYCLLFGLGIVGQPRRAGNDAQPTRRPVLIACGLIITAVGLMFAISAAVR
jgi:hypothetical protein